MPPRNTSKESAPNEESTSLATQGASNVPAFMRDKAGDGKENIDRGDLVIPRVALMQSVHKEVEEGKAEAGSFYHTILEEELGQDIPDLVIVHISKRYTLWNPRHAGGGILARADNGREWNEPFQNKEFEVQPDKGRKNYKVKWNTGTKVGRDIGLGMWGTSDPANEDSPPAATLTYVLVCFIMSRMDLGPFVILLQRSAEPVGKNLLTKVKLDANAPLYGQVYKLGQKVQGSPSGDFFQYTFAKNGYVPDEQLFTSLEEQFKQFDAMAFKYDDAEDDPAQGASGDNGSGGAVGGTGGDQY
jgi:hypothetical protein